MNLANFFRSCIFGAMKIVVINTIVVQMSGITVLHKNISLAVSVWNSCALLSSSSSIDPLTSNRKFAAGDVVYPCISLGASFSRRYAKSPMFTCTLLFLVKPRVIPEVVKYLKVFNYHRAVGFLYAEILSTTYCSMQEIFRSSPCLVMMHYSPLMNLFATHISYRLILNPTFSSAEDRYFKKIIYS